MHIEEEIRQMFLDLETIDTEGLIIYEYTETEEATLDTLQRIWDMGQEAGSEDIQEREMEKGKGDNTIRESDLWVW